MKRQGLVVTLNELHKLIEELNNEPLNLTTEVDRKDISFQINIINEEGLSDTWRIEK